MANSQPLFEDLRKQYLQWHENSFATLYSYIRRRYLPIPLNTNDDRSIVTAHSQRLFEGLRKQYLHCHENYFATLYSYTLWREIVQRPCKKVLLGQAANRAVNEMPTSPGKPLSGLTSCKTRMAKTLWTNYTVCSPSFVPRWQDWIGRIGIPSMIVQ